MLLPLNLVNNPTDEERHELLRNALENNNRSEDYDYIIKYLSPPPDITNYAQPGSLNGIKIGILGGGIAGMVAAFELRKLGADITILEASQNRIGGRIYTYYFDKEGKYYGEFGASRIPASQETTWHYANLFGLNMLPYTGPFSNNFRYVHNVRLRFSDSVERYLYPLYDLTQKERATPWNDLLSYAMNHAFMSLPPNIRSELIRVLPTYSPEILPLMNMSFRENLEKLGLSQGAIQLISNTSSTLGASLHLSYDELASMEYSLDGLLRYTIQGGFCSLPYAFYSTFFEEYPHVYQDIDKNLLGHVNMKLGHFVTGIYQSNYRDKIIIKYNNPTEASEGAEIFDYCICTIPFSSLRTVEIKPYFTNTKMQAIMELSYSDAQKTLFLCGHRFWEKDTDYGRIMSGASITDLPIQSILYPLNHNEYLHDRYNPANEPGVLVASYSTNPNATRVGGMKEPCRYQFIRSCVEEVHGLPRGFLNAVVKKSKTTHWNTEPYFRGAFVDTLPRQKPLFSYAIQRPEYNNRLFFAGDHVSSKHGWIQGSLYTGKAAANNLASSYNSRL